MRRGTNAAPFPFALHFLFSLQSHCNAEGEKETPRKKKMAKRGAQRRRYSSALCKLLGIGQQLETPLRTTGETHEIASATHVRKTAAGGEQLEEMAFAKEKK